MNTGLVLTERDDAGLYKVPHTERINDEGNLSTRGRREFGEVAKGEPYLWIREDGGLEVKRPPGRAGGVGR